LITLKNIKYVIKASSTLDYDYYNGFIDYCNDKILSYDEIQEYYNNKIGENDYTVIIESFHMKRILHECCVTDYKKACINSMIGGFKPNNIKKASWFSVVVTQCKLEALRFAVQYDESFVDTFKQLDGYVSYFLTNYEEVYEPNTRIDEYTSYFLTNYEDNIYQDHQILFYHVLAPHKSTNIETERPLYDQIVQQEAMELHMLKTLVESKGGKVTDLNTDAITCTFPNDICPFELIDDKNLTKYYWDDKETIPKYKWQACQISKTS
jgi:hypothetical protein